MNLKGKKYLVVSVHDVSPAFGGEVREIVSELKNQKIHKKSILVIPEYQGRYSILKDSEFLSWLYSLREEGDEIVQHGYEHISRNRRYGSFRDYLIGEFFAQGCAEFQNSGYEEARDKIKKGREILSQAGIICEGFIPPGWLMSPEANRAVMDEGFKYTAFIKVVRDYRNGLNVKSEVIRFVPQNRIAEYIKVLYNAYLLRGPLRDEELVRVAIHPQDVRAEKAFDYLVKIIRKLKKERVILTYVDFLNLFKG
ncbi:polysaccharide deacetylase family protein [Candidatus Aerophobetes bacterium]|nr:polysaccharide deacetylase family protein [Candidatus Aerophobetes bacterium]